MVILQTSTGKTVEFLHYPYEACFLDSVIAIQYPFSFICPFSPNPKTRIYDFMKSFLFTIVVQETVSQASLCSDLKCVILTQCGLG